MSSAWLTSRCAAFLFDSMYVHAWYRQCGSVGCVYLCVCLYLCELGVAMCSTFSPVCLFFHIR